MITKNDCLTLLVALEDNGVNIDTPMRKLVTSKEVPMDVLKFILEHRGIEVANFYEFLRKRHNQKKSPLYHNIVKDITDIDDVIITLSCLLIQIALYTKKLPDAAQEVFKREARASEITSVLNTYYSTGQSDQCLALLKLLKTDLTVLEYISGHREAIL